MKTLKKYKRKANVIDAIQLTNENIRHVWELAFDTIPEQKSRVGEEKLHEFLSDIKQQGFMKIKTPESHGETQNLNIGDYLVFGYSENLGMHCWPVEASYFDKNFEPCK